MYILGINASPRIGGNTDILLDKALEGAGRKGVKTEKIILNTLKFSACQECADLKYDAPCIIEDDMQTIFEKIKEADAIIFASPIFFGSLSAQAKAMVDRFQCSWYAKYIKKTPFFDNKRRKGVFISVEASERLDFFENAKLIVSNLFATINTDYKEELFYIGIDKKAAILNHPDYLKQAYEAGERIFSESEV